MSTIVSPHRGAHARRRWPRRRTPPPDPPDGHGLVLAEAEDREMTLGELRGFLGRAEIAAWEAGVVPDGLRFRVYIRHTGHARGISVKIAAPLRSATHRQSVPYWMRAVDAA